MTRLLALLLLLLVALPVHAQYKGTVGTGATAAPTASIANGFPVTSYSTGATDPAPFNITTTGPSYMVVIGTTASFPLSSVSGAGLTWTRRDAGTGSGRIYTAPSSGSISNQTITVSCGGTGWCGVALYSITNGTTYGAIVEAAGSTAAMSRSLTSTAAGSVLLWGLADFTGSTNPTAASGNTRDVTNDDGNGDYYHYGHYTTSPPIGTYTLGCTESRNHVYIAVEIKP